MIDEEARPEDDDYDLLTFGEAGARLVEEVRRQQRRIDELVGENASEDVIAKARLRLELLKAAQIRNKKPNVEEMRNSGFFGPRP
jgi:hypothetical protein